MPAALGSKRLAQAAEAVLVAVAMRGDVQAFTELVRRRQSWLRNLLRRLCRDPALADDLAQQVLLQAWRALPGLQSVAAFGAWLRRLALNAFLAHLRANPPRPAELELWTREDGASSPPPSATQLDLDQALACLAPEQRMCVVLAYHEGLSHGEISTATALPLGTVKSHVRRGAERLRELLSAYDPKENRTHAG